MTTHCFMLRHYDAEKKEYTEWEELTKFRLWEYYGRTPKEWKASCKAWMKPAGTHEYRGEIGGHYEYKIITRTEVVEWTASYVKNSKGILKPNFETLKTK